MYQQRVVLENLRPAFAYPGPIGVVSDRTARRMLDCFCGATTPYIFSWSEERSVACESRIRRIEARIIVAGRIGIIGRKVMIESYEL